MERKKNLNRTAAAYVSLTYFVLSISMLLNTKEFFIYLKILAEPNVEIHFSFIHTGLLVDFHNKFGFAFDAAMLR